MFIVYLNAMRTTCVMFAGDGSDGDQQTTMYRLKTIKEMMTETNTIPLKNDMNQTPTAYSITIDPSTISLQKNGTPLRSKLLSAEYTRYRRVKLHTHACIADTPVRDTDTVVASIHKHCAALTDGLCCVASSNRLGVGLGRTSAQPIMYVEYVLEFGIEGAGGGGGYEGIAF